MSMYSDMKQKILRKELSSPKMFKYLLWGYSGLTAASFAYFLALFSAGESIDTSWALNISTCFFSISLVVNLATMMVLVNLQGNSKFLYVLFHETRFGYVPFFGVWAFILAVAVLLFFYSFFSAVMALFSFWGCFKLFHGALKYIPLEAYEEDDLGDM